MGTGDVRDHEALQAPNMPSESPLGPPRCIWGLDSPQDPSGGVQKGSKTGDFQVSNGVETPDPWNPGPSGIAKLVNLRVPSGSGPFHTEFHGISGCNDVPLWPLIPTDPVQRAQEGSGRAQKGSKRGPQRGPLGRPSRGPFS